MKSGFNNMFSRFSKSVRILLLFIFVLIFLLIAAMIFAPGTAKNYINNHGKELAGRTIHIDVLKYNWFTSTLRIAGFKYFEKNDINVVEQKNNSQKKKIIKVVMISK